MSKKSVKETSEEVYSIMRVNKSRKLKNKIIIDGDLKAFFDGLLMGGGHLGIINHATYYFQRCSKREWLEYIQKYLDEHNIDSTITPVKTLIYCKECNVYDLKTKEYVELNIFNRRWYSEGKKRIPKDIDIGSPIFLANWYMGSGFLKKGRGITPLIYFFTSSFLKEDVEWLVKNLKNRLNLKGEITKDGKIRLDSTSTKKFIEIVKPYMHKDFAYKVNPYWRPSWDEYWMKITRIVAQRSTCLRRKTGAILVKDNRLIAQGYNGAPKGLPHCAEVGCLREQLKVPPGERHELCRGVHAEQNCVSGDTLVILPDGSIEEARNVHSEILSINKDLKVVSSPAFRFDTTKEDAVVIRTVGGFELTVSLDHIMFVMDENSGLSTKKASELTLNDYIPIVTRVDIEGEPQLLPKIEYDSYKLSKIGITRLKHLMKKKNLSQNRLSKIANVSRSSIKRLLKGEGVKKTNIYKIFNALNCDLGKHLIGVERKNVKIPKITSPELCQIVGYFIGDGNVSKNYITFEDENRDVLEFYNELIKKVFGAHGRIFKDKNENQYVLTVYSKRLSLFFKELGVGTQEKQIPKLFHKVERKSLAALLRGLFDAEGMVRKRPSEVILTSGHRRILETVRLLLLRFGIVSGIYAMKRTDKISSSSKDHSYALIISGEDLLEFKSKIGFSHPEKKKKLEQIDNVGSNRKRLLPKEFFRTRVPTAEFSNLRGRRWKMVTQRKAKEILLELKRKGTASKSLFEAEKLINSDIAFVKIKEIKKINYKGRMIDFYVPVTNSFIANGVVVHNCIVQAAVFGVSTKGATLYTTHFPCSICAKLLINAEISEIVYEEEYEDKLAKELLQEAGIKVRRFKLSEPPEIV